MKPWGWIHEPNTGAGNTQNIKGPLVQIPPEIEIPREVFEDLMRNADAAGYCAKARGANNYCVYSPDIDGFIRCANSA